MEIVQNSRIGLLTKSLFGGYDTSSINTILLAGIAVAVLILLILVIYLFQCMRQIPGSPTNKANISENAVDNVIAQIVENEEVEINSDLELVAVITAAIYATMGDEVPNDGLIVRSIRKVNNNKRWINA